MRRILLDITAELASELLNRSVDAVAVCLTALEKAVSKSAMVNTQEKKASRKPGRPLASETGDKLVWRSVGLDPATWEWVAESAAASGVTTNEYLRQVVAKARQG